MDSIATLLYRVLRRWYREWVFLAYYFAFSFFFFFEQNCWYRGREDPCLCSVLEDPKEMHKLSPSPVTFEGMLTEKIKLNREVETGSLVDYLFYCCCLSSFFIPSSRISFYTFLFFFEKFLYFPLFQLKCSLISCYLLLSSADYIIRQFFYFSFFFFGFCFWIASPF